MTQERLERSVRRPAAARSALCSLLLPVKAALLNLVSVGDHLRGDRARLAARNRLARDLGPPRDRAIISWMPLLTFAFLYGLSMDYEVFILTRIREDRDATGSTTAGIIEGVNRTGRLVTGAALIMFFAIAAMSTVPETDTNVMANALAVGIMLDATVVRALLVPALVALFGEWNWWLPRRARATAPAAGPAIGRCLLRADGLDVSKNTQTTDSEVSMR